MYWHPCPAPALHLHGLCSQYPPSSIPVVVFGGCCCLTWRTQGYWRLSDLLEPQTQKEAAATRWKHHLQHSSLHCIVWWVYGVMCERWWSARYDKEHGFINDFDAHQHCMKMPDLLELKMVRGDSCINIRKLYICRISIQKSDVGVQNSCHLHGRWFRKHWSAMHLERQQWTIVLILEACTSTSPPPFA